MKEIIREVSTLEMDVIVLTETKKKGTGSESRGNYIHIYCGVKKYERAKTRVSVLINKKWKGPIKNWEAIDERILKLEMKIWGYKLTIMGIYAPNEDNKATVKD